MNLLATLPRRLARPLAALGLLLATAGTAQAQTTTSFAYTGGTQSYTVPAGVTQLRVVAIGGSGGTVVGTPARGAQVTATVAVVPGEKLTVVVGGQGVSGIVSNASNAGGYNGGGVGGSGGISAAGGGGGATDLRRATTTPTDDYLATTRNALVVAGGGGGNKSDNYGVGGTGGTPTGGNGTGQSPGQGATQQNAGAAGAGGQAGSASQGGNGGGGNGGGGGGGGYYGGGGGSLTIGGGGGGSSFVTATGSSNISYSVATAAGNGSLTITPLVPFTVTGQNPAANAVAVPRSSSLDITFNQPVSPGTASNVRVFSAQRGGQLVRGGGATVTGGGASPTITVTPGQAFQPGETLQISVPSTVQSLANTAATPFAYQLTAAVAAGGGTFAPAAATVPTGHPSVGVALGDINGDGILDLVTADANGNFNAGFNNGDVTVSLGMAGAPGTFGTPGYYGGSGPQSLAVGDVNGDGRLDIITSNALGGVNVLLNQSTTTTVGFTSKSYSAGAPNTSSQYVALGDINGDGQLDIAVANGEPGSPSSVSVLLNQASAPGTFATGVPYTLGAYPQTVAVGDVNGDGLLDVVAATRSLSGVANPGTPGLAVLLNQASAPGTLGAATLYVAGTSFGGVALGDVDNDGRLDLVGTSYAASQLLVLLNQGGGTGTFGPASTYALSTLPRKVVLGDVDGNGRLDAVVSSFSGSVVNVLLQTGTPGTFAATTAYPAPNSADNVALGDVNGDARLDVAVSGGSTAAVLLNVAAAAPPLTITSVSPTPNARAAAGNSPVVVTFDKTLATGSEAALKVFSSQRGGLRTTTTAATRSGSTLTFTPSAYAFRPGEVVNATTTTAATGSGGEMLARGRVAQFTVAAGGTGVGNFRPGTDVAAGTGPRSVAVGDVNGDGLPDFVAANNTNPGTVSIRLGAGGGAFGGATSVGVGASPYTVVLGDVDGDGDLDLLTTNAGSGSVSVRLNSGTGTFTGSTSVSIGTAPYSLVLGDVNADGQLDFVTANYSGNNASVYLGNGDGTFRAGSVVGVGAGPYAVALGDVDGDGDLDLLTANYGGNSVSVRLGNGDGTFAGSTNVALGGASPQALAVGDVDGDGDLDVVTANTGSNTASILLGDGVGGFALRSLNSQPATGNLPSNITLGDVDGDGDLDLATTNYGDNTVTVLLNDGSGGFTPQPAAYASPAVGTGPQSLALADVDNDGDLDLLTANETSGTVSVRLNQVAPPTITSFNFPSRAVGSQLIINGTNLGGAISVRFGELPAPAGSFVANAAGTTLTGLVPVLAATNAVSVTTAGGVAVSPTRLLVTRASASLTYAQVADLQSSTGGALTVGGFSSPTVTDLDGNGRLDLLVGNQNGTVARYEQTSAGAATFTSLGNLTNGTGTNLTVGNYSAPTVTDLDGNGRLDLLVGKPSGVVARFEQSGPNATTFVSLGNIQAGSGDLSVGSNFAAPTVTDLDGDGLLDLLVGIGTPAPSGSRNGTMERFEQTSPNATTFVSLGNVQANNSDLNVGNFAAPTVTDLDGDGLLDLVVGSSGNPLAFYKQSAPNSATFVLVSPAPPATAAIGFTKPFVTDLDGDGRLDLLVGNTYGTVARFVQVPAPTLTSFTPTSGAVGSSVTLNGTNLTGTTLITFGGTSNNTVSTGYTVNGTGTQITGIVVPSGAQTGNISVTTSGGTVSTSGLSPAVFTVLSAPVVTTAAPANVTSTSATLGGTLGSDGGAGLTSYGVVYVVGPGIPTTSDTRVQVGTSSPATFPSTFSASVTGFLASTQYTVRAYATNSVGTSYGAAVSFTTAAPPMTAAPVLNTPVTNSLLATRTPTYAGTAPAGSTVTVYVAAGNGAAQAVGTTLATGTTFSLTQPVALADGSYRVYATATASGVVSANSNTNTFAIDATAPTVTSLTSTAGPSGTTTTTTPFAFTVAFSEAVTGFSAPGITVTNGTVSSGPTGSGPSYTFSVTPTTPGTATTVTIAANAAQDQAGNGSVASAPYTLTYAAPITATTWTGALSTDWFTAGNWSAGLPTATIDALIPVVSSGRYPLLNVGTASAKNLALNTSASLTQTGGTLALTGNLTNNGTLAATGGTVATTGSAAQTLGGSSPLPFYSLSVGTAGASQGTSISFQGVLTLTGNLTTNGQPLTLLSRVSGGVTQDGLVVNQGGVVVGTATVQRAIDPTSNPGPGYRHYSAPVGTTTVADLATSGFTPVVNPTYNSAAQPNAVVPFPTVYGYDDSRLNLTNNLAPFDKGFFSPATTGDPLAVGRGYTVNIRASELVDFVGTLNNGDRTLSLTSSRPTSPDGGWQLLGNPYPAPLDYALVDPTDRTGLEAAIYVYHSTGPYVGQYRSYVNRIGNSVLPVGQGFFARVGQGLSTATMTFRNSQRLSAPNGTTFQRTSAETRPLVQLTLQGTSSPLLDEATVYFESGASSGFEAAFDAEKLPNPTGLNLATSLADGRQLSIDGQAELGSSQRVVPLAVGVPAAGSYTFTANQLLNLSAVPVYLRDGQLGTLTDLRQQPTYQFTVANAAALLTGRFALVFSPQQPLATVPAALAQQVALYPNPAKTQATLELPAALGRQPVMAALLDALGRVVRQQVLPAGPASHSLSLAELASGVYSLRLITPAGVVVKKLVIE